jgi:hypothetical protein
MNSKIAQIIFGLGVVCAATSTVNASIVNINAAIAGADIPSGGGIWNHPIGGVTLSVNAGTYTFQVVDPRDNSDAIYTGWSFQSTPKYYTGYLVFDAANINAPIIDGSPSPSWFDTAQEAHDWAVASGHSITTYTFTKPTTLIFAVPDPYVPDDLGGVSVSVYNGLVSSSAQVAPEPGTGVLLACVGGMAIAFYRSSRRRRSEA